MKHWFVIRADASLIIGIGHIMRCLALAEWAIDHNLTAILITRNLPDTLLQNIKSLGIDIKELPCKAHCNSTDDYTHSPWLSTSEITDANQSADIIFHEQLLRDSPPRFILVDHYALAAPWEQRINSLGPILCIDDLNDRPHHCHWLIDQTFNKTDESYKGLTNKSCELFIGTTFALLRKEFQVQKQTTKRTFPHSNENWHVLVTLGGVDKFNITGLVLTLLSKTTSFTKLNITVVVGSTNPNIKELALLCKKYPID